MSDDASDASANSLLDSDLPPEADAEKSLPPEPTSPLLRALDEWLKDLWSPSLTTALKAAEKLYSPDQSSPQTPYDARAQEELAGEFWRALTSRDSRLPASFAERYFVVVRAVWVTLRKVRKELSPYTLDHFDSYMEVALRPVRRLQAGLLTPEVCAALYDYHRGVWTLNLSKPERWKIESALAKTIADLPPDQMDAFWENLRSQNFVVRGAMQLGLTFLRSAHAVPHLIAGLEHNTDHDTRAAIVDCLEQIAEPSALPTMIRLRRDTAQTDWTLSRHLGRAIRVIEQQNKNQGHRTLLRPSETPPNEPESLLRPAADSPEAILQREENPTLLRPAEDETNSEPDNP